MFTRLLGSKSNDDDDDIDELPSSSHQCLMVSCSGTNLTTRAVKHPFVIRVTVIQHDQPVASKLVYPKKNGYSFSMGNEVIPFMLDFDRFLSPQKCQDHVQISVEVLLKNTAILQYSHRMGNEEFSSFTKSPIRSRMNVVNNSELGSRDNIFTMTAVYLSEEKEKIHDRFKQSFQQIVSFDILHVIFSYIHRQSIVTLGLVCKFWRYTSFHSSLWDFESSKLSLFVRYLWDDKLNETCRGIEEVIVRFPRGGELQVERAKDMLMFNDWMSFDTNVELLVKFSKPELVCGLRHNFVRDEIVGISANDQSVKTTCRNSSVFLSRIMKETMYILDLNRSVYTSQLSIQFPQHTRANIITATESNIMYILNQPLIGFLLHSNADTSNNAVRILYRLWSLSHIEAFQFITKDIIPFAEKHQRLIWRRVLQHLKLSETYFQVITPRIYLTVLMFLTDPQEIPSEDVESLQMIGKGLVQDEIDGSLLNQLVGLREPQYKNF